MTIDDDIELTSVWSFPVRGRWSTHSADFRGNWAPQVPRNLIRMYTRPGETVLDPFLGSGTTLIEAKLLGRRGMGIDVNPAFVRLAQMRVQQTLTNGASQDIRLGDARDLFFINDESVDIALLHPPYWNAIVYSDLPDDISCLATIDSFLEELSLAVREATRVLTTRGTLAIMMGDLRKRKRIVPLGLETLRMCLQEGLQLKEIVIKVQHNCSSTPKWDLIARNLGFLLLMHEYIFIFDK